MPWFKRKVKSRLTLYKKTKHVLKRSQKIRIRSKDTSPCKKAVCLILTPRLLRFPLCKRKCLTFTPNKTPKRKKVCLSLQRFKSVQHRNTLDSIESKKKLEFEKYEVKRQLDCDQNNNNSMNVQFELENELRSNVDIDEVTCSDCSDKIEYENVQDNVETTIQRLKKLVKAGRFSTSSISFKLFEDTLKWYDSENTSTMRYSTETKDFFWTGYKLLGGQFLRFMRGFTNEGRVKENLTHRGNYNPIDTDINLPVPSDRVLREHLPEGVLSDNQVDPGIIKENIQTYSNAMGDTSFVVMFDGKKIIPNSADINLLDQEEEPKVSQLIQENENHVQAMREYMCMLESIQESGLTDLVDLKTENEKEQYTKTGKNIISILSTAIRELRKSYSKKALYLQTCEKKANESNDSKYKFVCNKLRTIMYQMCVGIKGLLEVIDVVAGSCSIVNGSADLFKIGQCNLTTQRNYRELRNDLSSQFPDISTFFLKQRSPEWFELRKSVKVTGSVAHTAVALESLSAQKKYFDSVFLDNHATENMSDIANAAMEHGAKNEINAVATLLSKILPVYFPNFIFHEEGAYTIKNEKGENLMIISPDGSLRNEDITISVEIKCPFSQYVGNTPVFYKVKPRHITQCMLEAEVTNAVEHLYISWSKDSTTVFRMYPKKTFVGGIVEEVKSVYYSDNPVRPKVVSERSKELRIEMNQIASEAEFMGEFPSVRAYSTERTAETGEQVENVYYSQQVDIYSVNCCVSKISSLIENAYKGIKYINEGFEFRKPMASEVLVYLMSDMDRNWHREIGHGLPIAYLFKGYSLSMATSRRILDLVLNACKECGAHVPCITFDGQFSRLKDFDDKENPLTLFVLQRMIWARAKKMNKKQVLEKIEAMFSNVTCELISNASVNENGILEVKQKYFQVYNAQVSILPIKTSTKLLKHTRKSSASKISSAVVEYSMELTAGLDEAMLDVLQNLEIVAEDTHTTEGGDPETESEMSKNEADTDINDIENVSLTQEENTKSFSIQANDYENIMKLLSKTKRKKWQTIGLNEIMNAFSSAEEMNKSFTVYELNEIIQYLSLKLAQVGVCIRTSMRKAQKINLLCCSIGQSTQLPIPEMKKRSVKIKSLRSLCLKELNRKEYPKDALIASYCSCIWPSEMGEWFDKSAVNADILLENMSHSDYMEAIHYSPTYSPELSAERNQLEVRVMDGTHIRTNIKSKLIRTGLGSIKLDPWKKVADSGSTVLKSSMLEIRDDGRIMHQQSDPFVRTMFCEAVEKIMYDNGDADAAKFCQLFRNWHEAEDQAGISAFERCKRVALLREWLLDGYDFSQFPPPTQYVKGIPRVTFEGLICSIEAHFLLYALVKGGTYNWRSVSTLVAENFMGELAERSTNNHGVPSGKLLPADMCKISQLHSMRLNPNRSFKLKTAKSRCYEIPDMTMPESNAYQPANPFSGKIGHVIIRDHQFDRREQHEPKVGKMSDLKEAPKGVQSVRYHYKVDESKILPSLRLGINDNDIKDLLT